MARSLLSGTTVATSSTDPSAANIIINQNQTDIDFDHECAEAIKDTGAGFIHLVPDSIPIRAEMTQDPEVAIIDTKNKPLIRLISNPDFLQHLIAADTEIQQLIYADQELYTWINTIDQNESQQSDLLCRLQAILTKVHPDWQQLILDPTCLYQSNDTMCKILDKSPLLRDMIQEMGYANAITSIGNTMSQEMTDVACVKDIDKSSFGTLDTHMTSMSDFSSASRFLNSKLKTVIEDESSSQDMSSCSESSSRFDMVRASGLCVTNALLCLIRVPIEFITCIISLVIIIVFAPIHCVLYCLFLRHLD